MPTKNHEVLRHKKEMGEKRSEEAKAQPSKEESDWDVVREHKHKTRQRSEK